MDTGNILIKQIDKNNFKNAKQLIKESLLEQGSLIILLKYVVQAVLLILALTASWIFSLPLLYLCILFLSFEFILFVYVRNMFSGSSSFELLGLSSWEEYSQRQEEKFDRFWVAIDHRSGDVIGTVEAQVFGKFKTLKMECQNDSNNNEADEHHISIEIKRLTISSSFRGVGLAQTLLDKVMEFVKEQREQKVFISKLVLFTNALQRAQRKLYEKNGFQLTNQWQLPIFVGLTHTTLCFYERKFEIQY